MLSATKGAFAMPFLLGPLVCVLLLAGHCLAQDKLCPKCDTTGRIPTENEKQYLATLEAEVLRCS